MANPSDMLDPGLLLAQICQDMAVIRADPEAFRTVIAMMTPDQRAAFVALSESMGEAADHLNHLADQAEHAAILADCPTGGIAN